jgi:hypothetical protein
MAYHAPEVLQVGKAEELIRGSTGSELDQDLATWFDTSQWRLADGETTGAPDRKKLAPGKGAGAGALMNKIARKASFVGRPSGGKLNDYVAPVVSPSSNLPGPSLCGPV